MTPGDITVRALDSGDQLRQAALLYRDVFGYTDPVDGVSPKMLRGLRDNGGIVVGALAADGTVVGFAYGFRGQDDAGAYHYSQAAVVAARLQGHQLGRRLKMEQARLARAQGLRRMRWAFDPLQVRNAHFNLNVLGARGVSFLPDYYQDGASDRVIVQWELPADGELPRHTAPPASPAAQVLVPALAWCPREPHSPEAAAAAAAASVALQEGFAQGLVLRGCDLAAGQAARFWFTAPEGAALTPRDPGARA